MSLTTFEKNQTCYYLRLMDRDPQIIHVRITERFYIDGIHEWNNLDNHRSSTTNVFNSRKVQFTLRSLDNLFDTYRVLGQRYLYATLQEAQQALILFQRNVRPRLRTESDIHKILAALNLRLKLLEHR